MKLRAYEFSDQEFASYGATKASQFVESIKSSGETKSDMMAATVTEAGNSPI